MIVTKSDGIAVDFPATKAACKGMSKKAIIKAAREHVDKLEDLSKNRRK
jgi:hypothetical protein